MRRPSNFVNGENDVALAVFTRFFNVTVITLLHTAEFNLLPRMCVYKEEIEKKDIVISSVISYITDIIFTFIKINERNKGGD